MLFCVKDISMKFGRKDTAVDVLKNISIEINKSEKISIIGPSGAGKSTFLSVLGGLEKPTYGKVLFNDIDMYSLSKKELADLRLKKFGFVFQRFYLIPALTVEDNILLPSVANNSVDYEYYGSLVDELQIKGICNKPARLLSGGEMQRVAIARAMINKPEVIFADEPTGNLDSVNGDRVYDLLFSCAEKHKQTLIYVTHDSQKAEMADRKFIIKDGVLVEKK